MKYRKEKQIHFFILIIFRHREEKLRNENEEKIRHLVKTQENEQKQLLEEFSRAHELLKIRISELQLK
jgi:hypothetical protein